MDCSLRNRKGKVHNEHQCSYCKKTLSTQTLLDHHIRLHTGECPYECPNCPEKFPTLGRFKRHMLTHTGKTYVCGECGTEYLSQYGLTAHQNMHSGLKPHKCPICGRGFGLKDVMKRHMRVHAKCPPRSSTNDAQTDNQVVIPELKTFECELCSKHLTTSHSLKKHIEIHHLNLRGFKCVFCGQEFSQSGNLKKHMRMHTGERPFECPDCLKTFRTRNELNKHAEALACLLEEVIAKESTRFTVFRSMRRNDSSNLEVSCPEGTRKNLTSNMLQQRGKTFVCNVCEKEFLDEDSLVKHTKFYSGHEPFICLICRKLFCDKMWYNAHMKSHKDRGGNE